MLKRSAMVSVTIMPRCPPRLTAVNLALPLDRTRPSSRGINTLSAPNSPEDLLKERRRSLFLVTLAMDPSVEVSTRRWKHSMDTDRLVPMGCYEMNINGTCKERATAQSITFAHADYPPVLDIVGKHCRAEPSRIRLASQITQHHCGHTVTDAPRVVSDIDKRTRYSNGISGSETRGIRARILHPDNTVVPCLITPKAGG